MAAPGRAWAQTLKTLSERFANVSLRIHKGFTKVSRMFHVRYLPFGGSTDACETCHATGAAAVFTHYDASFQHVCPARSATDKNQAACCGRTAATRTRARTHTHTHSHSLEHRPFGCASRPFTKMWVIVGRSRGCEIGEQSQMSTHSHKNITSVSARRCERGNAPAMPHSMPHSVPHSMPHSMLHCPRAADVNALQRQTSLTFHVSMPYHCRSF